MNRWIIITKLIFLGIFFVASIALAGYQWRYVWPVKKCEERGAWWDKQDEQCLTPMPIWRITNRKLSTPTGAPVTTPAALTAPKH